MRERGRAFLFAALQSTFSDNESHNRFLGIADEDDEVGQFHRHVLANLRPMWHAESDGRLKRPSEFERR